MICTLSALIAMAQVPKQSSPEKDAFKLSFVGTRTDVVTVVEKINVDWTRYRFKKFDLEVALPSVPKPIQYDLPTLSSYKDLVAGYKSETAFLYIELLVIRHPTGSKIFPWNAFNDYRTQIADDDKESIVSVKNRYDILSGDTRIWETDDTNGDDQHYFRLLNVFDGQETYLSVSGHKSNELLRGAFDYMVATLKKPQ